MFHIHDYIEHPFTEEIEKAVSKILQLLERHNFSGKALYVAQECLINELLILEDALRYCRSEIKNLKKKASELAEDAKGKRDDIPDEIKTETKAMYEEVEEYKLALRILRFGRWLFRYIGDGIAWYAYGHNRKIVRALGSKEPVPSPSGHEAILYERRVFRGLRHLGKEYVPLMHDLTNCLRTYDFSVFRNGLLERIFELKVRKSRKGEEDQKKTAYGNKRSLRQSDRQNRIAKFMESNNLSDLYPEFETGKSIESNVFEKHNFEALSRAIKKARKFGYGFEQPELGLLYVVWDASNQLVDEVLANANEQYPDFFRSNFTFRSLRPRFNEYHLILPITAMDLKSYDIVDILFGRIAVIIMVNYESLEEYCAQKGVPLKVIREADHRIELLIESEPIQGSVREGLWDRVMLEALSLESFTGLIKHIVDEYSE